MDISFVILTWNSEKYIKGCLESIFASLADSGLVYEILVVDNGSQDSSPEILKRYEMAYPATVVPILLDRNMGTTVSRNMALRRVTGKYVCVMDSDVEVRAGVFQSLLDGLRQTSSVGMVVPQILYPSGKWQKSFDCVPTLTRKIDRFFNLRRIEEEEARLLRDMSQSRDVEYAISAMWFFSTTLLHSVGLLDEKIFYSPEDVDYCIRIRKAGYRILYIPSATVVHHTQEISRGCKLNRAKFSHLLGLLYLFIKHKYFFRSPSLDISS